MWNFPSSGNGQYNNIGDSGIETFTGNPIKSLAREICQNSLDARVSESITVEFSTFNIPSSVLPGAKELKTTFDEILTFLQCTRFYTSKRVL